MGIFRKAGKALLALSVTAVGVGAAVTGVDVARNGSASAVMIFADREAPVITARENIISYDQKLEIADLADISDNIAKDLTVYIENDAAEAYRVAEDGQSVVFPVPGTFDVAITAIDQAENKTQSQVVVLVEDHNAPEILSYNEWITCDYNQSFSINEKAEMDGEILGALNIHASDVSAISAEIEKICYEDGITEIDQSAYRVSGSEISFSKPGDYVLGICVSDAYQNQTSIEALVSVEDHVKPELSIPESTYTITTEDLVLPDYRSSITALDEADGDLTKEIIYDESAVKLGVPGKYNIKCKVSDSAGNTVLKGVSIEVKDNAAPVITMVKQALTQNEGELPPVFASLATAMDNVDGNLTDEIIVDDSSVNYNKAGTYDVVFRVADSSDNQTEEHLALTVKELPPETTQAPKPETTKATTKETVKQTTKETVKQTTKASVKQTTKASVKQTTKASSGSSSGSGTTYILNKNTKKFHYSYCKSVKQMKEKNKIRSNESRASIIKKGYVPCKNCNP